MRLEQILFVIFLFDGLGSAEFSRGVYTHTCMHARTHAHIHACTHTHTRACVETSPKPSDNKWGGGQLSLCHLIRRKWSCHHATQTVCRPAALKEFLSSAGSRWPQTPHQERIFLNSLKSNMGDQHCRGCEVGTGDIHDLLCHPSLCLLDL